MLLGGDARASPRCSAPLPSSRRCISSSTPRWSPARSRSRPGNRRSRHGSEIFCGARRAIWPAAALAAVATLASERGWFGWLALLAVPLYLVFRSYHTVVARLREEQDQTHRAMEVQLATIEALALAIEAKAGCTPEHIRSIQQCAAMLAEAVGLSDEEVQAVRTAALLHDVGNMAVPEHILAKPDALTPEEFERVKIHPRVGADILRERAVRRAGRASSCSAITNAGTASGIRPDCAARRFRSALASWRLPTATARCRRIARTGRRAPKPQRSWCCASSPARRSIRRSSTC